MNEASFVRFADLCRVSVGESGRVCVSIARCERPTRLPHRIERVERHPLGSQALVPLAPKPFVVVVGPAATSPCVGSLQAFVTNGSQGVSYYPGTWHMPLIAFESGQEFLVIDRAGDMPNCDLFELEEPVVLVEEGSARS